ncbi:hypothetical protein niasHS_007615 [Heterodera schachtii]|uniref:Centromere/kinetochore protein zw10 homolog n=1 Tax=Heterodera schachtii TaxID=97005 RepID=A0ABD2JP55_HETSC
MEIDKEIAELEQEISKSINEVAKDLELKYRDFVPSYIGLADCQDKIQMALQNGKENVIKMEEKLTNAEKEIVKLKENAPHKKLGVVQDLVDRLAILDEMEQCLNTLWLMPTDSKTEFDPLAITRTILRLTELCAALESESSNYLESINERILPLLFAEIETRKGELCQQLSDFYASFFRFTEDDRVSPPLYSMGINCPSIKTASDCFSAMRQLDLLEDRLEEMVDIIWEHFCLKLIYAVTGDGQNDTEWGQLIKVQTDKFAERSVRICIAKEVEIGRKPSPTAVFGNLCHFFDSLHMALKGIRADDRPLVDLLGEAISEQLINTIEKGCLGPAIPFEKYEAAKMYDELRKLSQSFLGFMQEKGFFVRSVDHLFGNFFDSFERISVDRRCHHFITTARELIKQPYIELVEAGSALDSKEEKSSDILWKMEEKLRIKADDEDSRLPTSTKWDKYFTKTFQFQHCQISKSTFNLVVVLHDVLRAAAETDSEMEASRLVTTARNIVEMFATTAPEYHRLTLSSVPHMAAVFFNNCHFIVHRLSTLSADILQNILTVSKITGQDCAFTDLFTELRILAATTLEQHITQARRQLSATIGEDDIFVGLRDDKTNKHCVKLLNGCVMQLEQTASVWREVLSDFVLTHCVGELVSYLLSAMANIILAKEDIASSDAEISANLLTTLVDRCKKLMEIDGQPTIQRACEEPYHKLQEIIFCLNGNLAEIGHRWCEGTGPLALWLKPAQVKRLVRALFQNTERRAILLAQIN